MIALGLLVGLATLVLLLVLDRRRAGNPRLAGYALLVPGVFAASAAVLVAAMVPSWSPADWPRVLGVLAPITAVALLIGAVVRYPRGR